MPQGGPTPPRHLPVRVSSSLEISLTSREGLVLLLSMAVTRCGEGADSGTDGLRLALEWRPDAVITDIGLPDLDGWRLGQRLREELGDSPALVALTSHDQPSDHQRSGEAGFDAHLRSRADPPALFRLLGEAS